MSWLKQLAKTYDNAVGYLGDQNEKSPLLPIGHVVKENATISILIDSTGKFLDAKILEKENSRTIIPVTEASSARTSGSAPHPLADKLEYVAGDYVNLSGNAKKAKYFEEYNENLKAWNESSHSIPEIQAVYKYVSKGRVISDLIKAGIFHAGDDGMLLDTWKGDANAKPAIFKRVTKQADSFITWRVEIPQKNLTELQWCKKTWQSWTNYCSETLESKGICHITLKNQFLSSFHPKGILLSNPNAKLLSSNDLTNFTYRGRFHNSDQACQIGYNVSQKAHAALSWLIRRQGMSNSSQTVVVWSPENIEIINPLNDTFSLNDILGFEATEPENTFSAAQNFAKTFNKYISGYSQKISATNNIIIMVLDTITTRGRVSIKYYRELTASDYLYRVQAWHTNCCWRQNFSKKNKFIGAPSPDSIAKSAYGSRVDVKLLKATIERILPCIVDGMPFPKDIIRSCLNNAIKRTSMEAYEWNKIVGITCALYKYQNIERNYSMALETDRTSRDYLYGRLLAVAESIEGFALSSNGENRSTNAERLLQRFAEKPFSTWRTIELALAPYKQRLKVNKAGFLINREKLIGEIKNLFNADDFCDDSKLTGEFLLGYDCQRNDLYNNSNND